MPKIYSVGNRRMSLPLIIILAILGWVEIGLIVGACVLIWKWVLG